MAASGSGVPQIEMWGFQTVALADTTVVLGQETQMGDVMLTLNQIYTQEQLDGASVSALY